VNLGVVVTLLALVVALAAAVRSTWSPCGQSMLSQITPVAEAARGHKFGRTAAFFLVGALLGSLTLGLAIAVGAALFAAADLGTDTTIALVAVCAALGAVVDTHVLGFGPPFLRRQVNEDWLMRYRPWVYGGGFGWQIGFGLSTYVMTAAVGVMILLGALSASPAAAVLVAVVFGLARGSAVFLGVPLRTRPALYAFHRRFHAAAEPVRQAVIALQLLVALGAIWYVAPAIAAAGLTVAGIGLFAWSLARAPRRSPAGEPVSRSAASRVLAG
jgi:hypothetical protein